MLSKSSSAMPMSLAILTEQNWGDVSTLMEWNRCAVACCIAKLLVRSMLADFGEAWFDENGDDFIGFEDGNIAHDSSDSDILNPNKLRFRHGFAIFQQHCNDFVQVAVEFIQCCPLGMNAGKTWNKTDEQAGLWTPFNDR
jgi:hypothetical protein